MRCRRCGFELDGGWSFCPKCGARKGDMMDSFGRDIFSQLFSQMKDSFKDMDNLERMFDKDLEALDLSPWFRREQPREKRVKPIRGKGFSVHITRGTGMEPKVDIKTYGDVNRERIERELHDKFGVEKKERPVPVKAPAGRRFPFPGLKKTGPGSSAWKPLPKSTEEPKADIRRVGNKVTVDIEMPGVRSGDDVEVKELESSVEVKAMTGDKAYFKILTKPAQFGLTGKSLKDGVLHLEFS